VTVNHKKCLSSISPLFQCRFWQCFLQISADSMLHTYMPSLIRYILLKWYLNASVIAQLLKNRCPRIFVKHLKQFRGVWKTVLVAKLHIVAKIMIWTIRLSCHSVECMIPKLIFSGSTHVQHISCVVTIIVFRISRTQQPSEK